MNPRYIHTLHIAIGIILISAACTSPDEHRFRRVPAFESGISFNNSLIEQVDFNIFNYMYFYNGGGVATGDLNGDDLPDIYFTANQQANKLYINQGQFKFKEVSKEAGVAGFDGWSTGVTMADVNGDGLLDIYVGYLGDYLIYHGRNQLFINEGPDENGIPHFTDQAMAYGLDLVGFATQAAFFDYDRDGDLDMFMLNHSVHENGTFVPASQRYEAHTLSGDRLLKNEQGHFVDVTAQAGIHNSVIGYGLGLVVSDVNLDGWPDIYVGNDFHENDYLYINQGDGTFQESLQQMMRHTSRYTMGVDVADFNNDAFPDVMAMDMLPEDPTVLKASAAEDTYDVYDFKIRFGYNHQFARNTLQVNNQNGTFSEIGLYAGVAATDWSWATLWADFDLDGRKDLFITNGIYRRPNDLDYINFITVDSLQLKMKYDLGEKELSYIQRMPRSKVPNYLYRNMGDTTFTNQAEAWGLTDPSCSHGAAYADLDNDGDWDLVMNNVDDEAFIYENKTIDQHNPEKPSPYALKVYLKGPSGNRFGIGTKVFLYSGGQVQMQECMPTRGYESSVDTRLIFGLGKTKEADSLCVVWPNGRCQTVYHVAMRKPLVLSYAQATQSFNYARLHQKQTLLTNTTDQVPLPYKHEENKFVEFNREALLPHMLSTEGPAAAVADVNGDGLEDIFLGGGKWSPARLLLQNKNGRFTPLSQPLFRQDSTYEDVDAVFFDADQDGDQDLFVVSGGNEFANGSAYQQPRLYLNDGAGNLTRANGIPEINATGSCARISDIDGDGDKDIFLGIRAIPWKYGLAPDSYILQNNGHAQFTDVTDRVAPSLTAWGFVKDATWADVDADGDEDLVIAGEWSPITILINQAGNLKPLQNSGLEYTHGWWNTLTPADVDQDGDIDFIAGNLGLNSKLHASRNEPVQMYVHDFDQNGQIDQVLTHFMQGRQYPFCTRDEMTKQLPYLKKKYLSYHVFAKASVQEMFTEELLKEATQYNAYTFQTAYIENLGNNTFKVHPLPGAAQWAPVYAVLVDDFNDDSHPDILLGGNFFGANIQRGRYDAGEGVLLQGDGKGHFKPVPPAASGFSVRGETRMLQKMVVKDTARYLAIRNNNTIQAFSKKKGQRF